MKALVALVILFALLGCERRDAGTAVAYPEIQEVKEWLLSEEGQGSIYDRLIRRKEDPLDQFVPYEDWVAKRLIPEPPLPGLNYADGIDNPFLVFAKEKTSENGTAFCPIQRGNRFIHWKISSFDFERIGSPRRLGSHERFFPSR